MGIPERRFFFFRCGGLFFGVCLTQSRRHSAPTPSPPPSLSMALAELRAELGKQIRICISDGRIIEGEFQCMDSDMNFIIGGAIEYHGIAIDTVTETLQIPTTATSRSMGMAMVPGKHVVKCFLKVREAEEESTCKNT